MLFKFKGLTLSSLKAGVYTSLNTSLVSLKGLLIREASVKARIKLIKVVKSRNFSLKLRF
jgi:hypothetical protein